MVQKRTSPVFSAILILLAVVCAAAAVFYWTVKTDFLTFGGSVALHHKHAAIFAGLAVVFLIGAVLARPRTVSG